MDNDLMFEYVYMAVYLLAHTDRRAQAALNKYIPTGRVPQYIESIMKNPNQTQVAQRIYAHAVAERLGR